MLKPRPIDKYIKRATAGLPHLERIDTAAEIRVNLNLRIKELMLDGHPRDEAEFLAIQGMGDAFTTNRALLGHAFTHRIGWVLVGATVLVGAGLWVWQHRWDYFWVETTIQKVDLTTQDISNTLQRDENYISRGFYQKFELNLPKFTKSIEILYVQENKSEWFVGLSTDPRAKTTYDSVRIPEKISLWISDGILKTSTFKNELHSISAQFEGINQGIIELGRKTFEFGYWNSTGVTWAKLSSKDGTQTGGNSFLIRSLLQTTQLELEQWSQVSYSKIVKNGEDSSRSHNKVAVLIRPTAKSKLELIPIQAKIDEDGFVRDANGNPLGFVM
jgi:hypothetical protein